MYLLRGRAELSRATQARCVSLFDDALSDPLFELVAGAVRALKDEHLERTYQTTFWFPLAEEPRSVVEIAALALAPRLPQAALARGGGGEWGLGRVGNYVARG